MLVDDVIARREGLHTGDVIGLQLARGSVPVEVRGVYRNENFIGIFGQAIPIILPARALDLGAGEDQQDTLVLVTSRSGQDDAARVTPWTTS